LACAAALPTDPNTATNAMAGGRIAQQARAPKPITMVLAQRFALPMAFSPHV